MFWCKFTRIIGIFLKNEIRYESSWTALLSDGKRCCLCPRAQSSSWPDHSSNCQAVGPTVTYAFRHLGIRPRRGKLLDLWSAIRGFKTTNWRCPTRTFSELQFTIPRLNWASIPFRRCFSLAELAKSFDLTVNHRKSWRLPLRATRKVTGYENSSLGIVCTISLRAA